MPLTAKPRAELVIERPLAVVRAQFFDLDHHVRAQVHRGTKVSWTLGAPGERRLKQETHVLGRVLVDELVIAEERGRG